MAAEAYPVDLIERQQWLEPVEGGLQKAVHAAYQSSGATGRKVKNFLNGTWLGHPLHPVLTDIPIGSWTAAAVLDIADMAGSRGCAGGADAAVKIGLVGAVAAAVTGLTDWQDTDGPARRVGVTHGLMNLTSAGLYTASMMMRSRRRRGAGRAFSFAGFCISMMAAYLGGNLVYGKQIGVNHTAGEPMPTDWTPVLADDVLGEGEMRRVEAKGVKVLVARQNGQVTAIAEVCSHLGGPLAEGELQDGVVQCPWHGSRFRLKDGRVEDGPATHPQPCFEVRLREGQIQVRGRSQE